MVFGDYFDLRNPQGFGKAYQSIPLTNNENDIIKFVNESQDSDKGGKKSGHYTMYPQYEIKDLPTDEPDKRSLDGAIKEFAYTRIIASRATSEQCNCGYEAYTCKELCILVMACSEYL